MCALYSRIKYILKMKQFIIISIKKKHLLISANNICFTYTVFVRHMYVTARKWMNYTDTKPPLWETSGENDDNKNINA